MRSIGWTSFTVFLACEGLLPLRCGRCWMPCGSAHQSRLPGGPHMVIGIGFGLSQSKVCREALSTAGGQRLGGR